MNVGVFSTRLAGTDGVSLEAEKVATVLERRGHQVYNCAGELDGDRPGSVVPGMHFADPTARALHDRAFAATDDDLDHDRDDDNRNEADRDDDRELIAEIEAHARSLVDPIEAFVEHYDIEAAVVQNAFAIPMHPSLAMALHEVLARHQIPTLGHHHDLHWERARFASTSIGPVLDRFFPPAGPYLTHAVINSIARAELVRRRGIEAAVMPNVFDFDTAPPGIDSYNADFREAIGVGADATLVLQPTRVIPRKRIEVAIELVARLDRSAGRSAVLVVTHDAADEGVAYLARLRDLARAHNVELLHVADRIGPARGRTAAGAKRYSLWDVYPHADFVTFPSAIEGFGNAFLEAIYFRRPLLVGRYPVYRADIAPLGFDVVECDDEITDDMVDGVADLLTSSSRRRAAVDHNYQLARQHFGYGRLDRVLPTLLPV